MKNGPENSQTVLPHVGEPDSKNEIHNPFLGQKEKIFRGKDAKNLLHSSNLKRFYTTTPAIRDLRNHAWAVLMIQLTAAKGHKG